jgi:hypothetical protein
MSAEGGAEAGDGDSPVARIADPIADGPIRRSDYRWPDCRSDCRFPDFPIADASPYAATVRAASTRL